MNMVCTFFGHRDTPEKAGDFLRKVLVKLIEEEKAELFYVGNHGRFDGMVWRELEDLKKIYPHIRCVIVLAYMPQKNAGYRDDQTEMVYPCGLENTPPRYAIDKRNRWMIEQADTVVTYVTNTVGGAAKYKRMAERKGRTVINLV